MSIRNTVISIKFSVFLLVAITFIGLGMLLDGRVLDKQSSDDVMVGSPDIHPQSTQHSDKSDRQTAPMVSEITEQVHQAVDRENLEEKEQSAVLKKRAESAIRRISEARQIVQENGIVHGPQSESARQQSINRDIETLKERLAELE